MQASNAIEGGRVCYSIKKLPITTQNCFNKSHNCGSQRLCECACLQIQYNHQFNPLRIHRTQIIIMTRQIQFVKHERGNFTFSTRILALQKCPRAGWIVKYTTLQYIWVKAARLCPLRKNAGLIQHVVIPQILINISERFMRFYRKYSATYS